MEWLDPAGVRACEPAFAGDRVVGGVFCEWNGQINPIRLTRALARGACRAGATVRLGTAVEGIAVANGRVTAVRTSDGDIPCEVVVIAAGAWAAEVGAMAGVPVPVVPARGQILLTEPAPRLIRRVLGGIEPSARQTRRGNVIVGSTVEAVGYDKSVTTDTLAAFAREVLPSFPALRGPAGHPGVGRAAPRLSGSPSHRRGAGGAGRAVPGRRPQPPRHLLRGGDRPAGRRAAGGDAPVRAGRRVPTRSLRERRSPCARMRSC